MSLAGRLSVLTTMYAAVATHASSTIDVTSSPMLSNLWRFLNVIGPFYIEAKIFTLFVRHALQCPLRRKIRPGYVPIYYHAQVQVLLEIMDLELAHFVEYRPETTFSAKELQVTEVRRDRDWFEKHLPAMRDFCDEMNHTPEEEIYKLANRLSPKKDSKIATLEIDIQRSPVKAGGWLGLTVEGCR